jgi:hypothetical protein
MRLRDVGWCWEGQGLDPGVYPSMYGVGEGCRYFGLKRAVFLFHPIDRYALEKMADLAEIACDISETHPGYDRDGLTREVLATPERTRARAEIVSQLSRDFPNVTGGFFDDLKGLIKAHNYTVADLAATRAALGSHNPALKMWSVVYGHELDDADFWASVAPYIDIINLWIWQSADLEQQLDAHVERCRALFPGKPLNVGCYLRDYGIPAPVPVERLALQFNRIVHYLERGLVSGYSILAAVLIEGHREQAEFVRDFIAAHY